MNQRNVFFLFFICSLLFCGCREDIIDFLDDPDDDQLLITQETAIATFQPAGEIGGGVLEVGTFFPPSEKGVSTLTRGENYVSYEVYTDNLPPGAYTNWLVIINNPEACEGECDESDVFGIPETESSVYWSASGVVEEDGIGQFSAKSKVGDYPSSPQQIILGNGLTNSTCAEVWVIIKYHGPVSDDPDEFFLQTHTLLGLCDEGANALDLGPGFGVQCFDPQRAIHHAPQSCE